MSTQISKNETTHGGKVTKIEHYKWDAPIGTPGTFRKISKHELRVDHSYQRPEDAIDEDKVNKIAAHWSWPAFTTIVVARRKNGSLYILDGQHRWLAALKRADVTTLPCVIYDMESLLAEAKAFLQINTMRKPVGAVAKFPALIQSKDPDALLVQKLVEAAGRVIGGNPGAGYVRCAAKMLDFAKNRPDQLARVFPLVATLFIGKGMDERVISGLVYIETALEGEESVSEGEWRKRILKIGSEKLKDGALRAAAFYKRGGDKVWARGIITALNFGHRNQLSVDLGDE